jgi:hypothetical protein
MIRPVQQPAPWNQRPQARNQDTTIWGHFVESFKRRRLIRIDGKTASIAIPVLSTLTQQAKLALEYQSALVALGLGEIERDVKVAELDQRKLELAVQRRHQEQLAETRLSKERLSLQLEIARLQRQIQEQRQPPIPTLTTAQQKLLKKAEIEEEIHRLRIEEARALQQITGELEKRRIQNMYAARRDRLMERLEQFL